MPYPVIANVLRLQWIWEKSTGLPTDVAVNTFYFQWQAPEDRDSAYAKAKAALVDFWVGVASTLDPVNVYIPDTWPSSRIKAYDLSQPAPRFPFADDDAGVAGTASGSRYPSEVACALSFRSGQGARKRGRVFIGPLATSSGSVVGGEVRPTVAFRSDLAAAAQGLIANSGSLGVGLDEDVKWAQVSPTAGSADTVKGGWVDDSYDTIRSRGADPTERSLWGDML